METRDLSPHTLAVLIDSAEYPYTNGGGGFGTLTAEQMAKLRIRCPSPPQP